MKQLPTVRYKGKFWFFDARLRRIRTVRGPIEFYDLNDFEVRYFEDLVMEGSAHGSP